MKANDARRIALVARGNAAPQRKWNTAGDAPYRVVFVNAFTVLRAAVANRSAAVHDDVAAVVLDHCATSTDFLELLAELPPDVPADVLIIGGCQAFLSAAGRGGDRVVYRLSDDDVAFYFRTKGMVREAEAA